MSWVALGVAAVGAAVSVGTQAYSSSQQKKAAKKQQGALGNIQELEPVPLGDPAQIDMRKLQNQAIDIPFDNLEYASRLSRGVNKLNYSEAHKYYNKIQPFFDQLQMQIGTNTLSFARGQIPNDVANEIQRTAAERGIQGGFGFGSQGAQRGALANLNLRNLGLTSLDLSKYGTNLGMQVNAQAKNLLPNLTSPMDFLFTPQQFLGAEGQNVAAQNQFALQNNQILNNAAVQNTSLQNSKTQAMAQLDYNQALAQAQMVSQIGSSIGGSLMSYGSGMGGGATGAGAGGLGTEDWRIMNSQAGTIQQATNAGATPQSWQTNALGARRLY